MPVPLVLLLFAPAAGLPPAPDPLSAPAAESGPVRAPPGPAKVKTLREGIGGADQLAGQLVSDGRIACWLSGMDSDAQALACASLAGGEPFTVAKVAGKLGLVLSNGTLTWTDSPFPRPGALRRAKVTDRGAGPVETLADHLADPHGLSISEAGVLYWLEDPGGGIVPETIRRLSPGGVPETIAKPDAFTVSTALAGDELYVGTTSGILVVPLAGGPSRWIAKGHPVGEVALSGDHVYWTSDPGRPHAGSIWRAPIAGGAPQELAERQTYPGFLSLGDGKVYWTDPYASAILRIAEQGGPVELVAGKQFVHGMQLAGTQLFWIAQTDPGDQVLRTARVPRATPPLATPEPGPACRGARCAAIVASGLQEPSGIAVAPRWVFWTDARTGTLSRARIAGGAPESVLTGEDHPGGLVAAHGALFWADAGSGLVRSLPLSCARAGCVPRTVAKADGRPHALIAACDALYWAEQASDESRGRVRKLAFQTGTVTTVSDLDPLGLAVDGGWVYLLLGGGLSVAEDEYAQIFRVPADGGHAQSLVGYHHAARFHLWPPPAYAPGGVARVHLKSWIRPVAFGVRDGRLYWMEETGTIRWLDPSTAGSGAFGGGPEEAADVPARGGVPAGTRLAVAERAGTFLWAEGRLYWASSYAGDVPVGAIYSRAGDGPIEPVADGRASALAAGGGALFYLGFPGNVVRVTPP